MDNQRIKVSIFGKSYLLLADQHSGEILQAAEMVDSLMKKASEKMPTSTESKTAVLVCLQIAADLIKKNKLLQVSEERIEKLVDLLVSEDRAL